MSVCLHGLERNENILETGITLVWNKYWVLTLQERRGSSN